MVRWKVLLEEGATVAAVVVVVSMDESETFLIAIAFSKGREAVSVVVVEVLRGGASLVATEKKVALIAVHQTATTTRKAS